MVFEWPRETQEEGLVLLRRDSMSEDLYRALKCFLVEFYDLKQYQASTNYTAMYHLNNIPGNGGLPKCLHLLGNARLCYVSAGFRGPLASGVVCCLVLSDLLA